MTRILFLQFVFLAMGSMVKSEETTCYNDGNENSCAAPEDGTNLLQTHVQVHSTLEDSRLTSKDSKANSSGIPEEEEKDYQRRLLGEVLNEVPEEFKSIVNAAQGFEEEEEEEEEEEVLGLTTGDSQLTSKDSKANSTGAIIWAVKILLTCLKKEVSKNCKKNLKACVTDWSCKGPVIDSVKKAVSSPTTNNIWGIYYAVPSNVKGCIWVSSSENYAPRLLKCMIKEKVLGTVKHAKTAYKAAKKAWGWASSWR